MRRLFLVPLLGLLVLPAACVAPSAPEPAPAPPPPPPPPAPQPEPAPAPLAWQDRQATPGDWRYRQDAAGSIAEFGTGAGTWFSIRCDRGARRIALARPGVLDPGKAARLTLRATEGASSYPLANQPGAAQPQVAATLAASDPFLDKMAYSRGRFLVQVEGAEDLVIPNWAEFARVVEDCRA